MTNYREDSMSDLNAEQRYIDYLGMDDAELIERRDIYARNGQFARVEEIQTHLDGAS